jgi:DNA polymerase elongation subunit (family B)
MFGIKITKEAKLDAMQGFSGLQAIHVWKLSFPAIWMYKTASRTLKNCKIGSRKVLTEDVYEANLPPFIRLFHELNISPASPIEFEGDDFEPDDDVNADVFYEIDYKSVTPNSSATIPLYTSAYDIETYSESGNFPVSTNQWSARII